MNPTSSTLKHLLLWITLLIFSTSQCAIAGSYTIYMHHDALGNVVAKTDQRGHVISRESLTPFGQSLGTTDHSGNITVGDTEHRIGYTGHVNDRDLGLTYMQARYYDATVGRFMGVDPVGYSPGKPEMFNRFAYANNNSYRYVDPDGESGVVLEAAALAGFMAIGVTTGLIDTEAMTESLATTIDGFESTVEQIGGMLSEEQENQLDKDGFDTDNSTNSNPISGEPGTCSECNNTKGEKKQRRFYGNDGWPSVDIDYDHNHGAGQPHAHDWNNPSDGTQPSNTDRQPGRELSPQESKGV